jgi:type I restriction enzyme S subunit
MMREYKRYKEYKDSGISWIGEIPKNWILSKIKYEYTFFTGFTPPSGNDSYYDIDGYDWLNISDIKNKYIDEAESKISEKAIKEYRPKISKKNSLVFSFKLSIGKTAILKSNIYTNEALATFEKNKENNIRYLYYIAPIFIPENAKENIYGAKILNQRLINDALLLKPSKQEQRKIASFLDQKTAEIDEIINKKESLIDYLEKYKKSVITEAVTKGKLGDKYINEEGELVDKIEMKDSGVEWIGEIPEYWDLSKMKFLTEVKDGTHDTPEYIIKNNNSIPLITSKHIEADKIKFESANHISHEDYKMINQRSNVKKHDVLMPMIGTIGNPVIVNNNKKFSIKNLALFKTEHNSILAKWIYYYLKSEIFDKQVKILNRGGVQSFLSLDVLRNLEIAEMSNKIKSIVTKYLEQKTSQIDKLINKTKQSIEKNKEYKKSLIFEAVTGKIDLRDYELEGGEELAEHNNSSETERERISAVD